MRVVELNRGHELRKSVSIHNKLMLKGNAAPPRTENRGLGDLAFSHTLRH